MNKYTLDNIAVVAVAKNEYIEYDYSTMRATHKGVSESGKWQSFASSYIEQNEWNTCRDQCISALLHASRILAKK